ncbi:hypothetical protein T552_03054 [Pneumocystis carinii B80]|uniref:RING-type domain-containing protein n=1 Tax=Pneumocystis carinii (strain B80) TaxID=1408658 RepID=A0A0W4ZCV1_PNEC8|nr:hypothetical protein T552_03054 [Pneumocystis carinii B80]KTW26163.1 hypothetical protein T552_03054 [Pneumocystis carinii B80]
MQEISVPDRKYINDDVSLPSKSHFELLQLESLFPDADPLYLAECLAYYDENAVQRSTLKIIFHCYGQYPKKGPWMQYICEDDKKNAKLDILNEIFPNIDIECLRNELIRRDDTYLLKSIESLLNIDIESTGVSRLRIGKIEPWQRFRSYEYISSVRYQLISEFPDVPSSTINAVMVENNNDYYRSKMALSRMQGERWWKSLVSFVRKKRSKLNYVICEELSQEMLNLEKSRKDEIVMKDFEHAVQLNWQEYYDKGLLIECGCCFFEYAWETLAYCSEGHIVCKKCLEKTVQEGIYGQGNLRGQLRIKCIFSNIESVCTGFYSKDILKNSLPSDLLKAYEDSLKFRCIFDSSCQNLVTCPFCGYAEFIDIWKIKFCWKIFITVFMMGFIMQLAFFLSFTWFLSSLVVITSVYLGGFFFIINCSSNFLRKWIDKTAYRILRKRNCTLFKCRNVDYCGKFSCCLCRKEWMPFHKCFEKELDGLRLYVEREMANAVKRTCPVCNLSFVKSDGCNKLICQCGYVMCYICRKNIKKESYAHFCHHFRSVPGKKCSECTKCDLYKVNDNIAEVAERATKEYFLKFKDSEVWLDFKHSTELVKDGPLLERIPSIINNLLELFLEHMLA